MQQSQPEFITIKDKTYKVSDLPEQAITLANNIQLIQNEIAHKQTEAGIYQIAADSLINQLVDATNGLEEVKPEPAE